jgi:hypothetical protein
MSITVMKQALEALDRNWDGCVNSPEGEAITALRAAIEAAEKQEPVAWRYDLAKYRENDLRGRQWARSVFSPTKPYIDEMVRNLTPLYTTPPAAAQRPLVWLSEEDEREIKDRCTTVACVLRAVKAKLKGKNK